MADIQINPKRGKRSKVNPRIDLTPMVDLGFLLITFFMMTTSMHEPKAMDIQMPFTPALPGGTVYFESSAITLLPAKDHRIFYYEGKFDVTKKLNVVQPEIGLRSVLLKKQQSIAHREKPDERLLQVLIKCHETATVEDMVGLFDEMDILKITHFAMVDIYPEENEMIVKQIGN